MNWININLHWKRYYLKIYIKFFDEMIDRGSGSKQICLEQLGYVNLIFQT